MNRPEHVPVILGVGEVNDRQSRLNAAELMVSAARAAMADAGGRIATPCDWLAIVPQITFPDLDLRHLLTAALEIRPPHVEEAALPSGDTPVRYLNDAANAIARGEASVCLIVGGEAVRTAARLAAERGGGGELFEAANRDASLFRRRYGLINPVEIYPLYENAARAAWGQTLAEGQAETGAIWSRMSGVAVTADGAWIKAVKSSAEIVDHGGGNRPIAFPYTKFMVANAAVNQGAAVIVTSLAVARAAGVAEDRLAFVGAGAAAHEPEEPLERARWDRVDSMRVALERTLTLNGLGPADLDHVELYSCFPCVPKLARRVIQWPLDKPVTLHGGLTFGGGPIGNYMTHAIAAMTRRIRRDRGTGLLFGNGGYCTHNHAILLTGRAPKENPFPQDYDHQAEADVLRGPIPPLCDDHEGAVRVETYTLVHDRSAAPAYGIVLGRDAAQRRIIARVDPEDMASIAFLTDGRREPVGSLGITRRRGDRLFWRAEGGA